MNRSTKLQPTPSLLPEFCVSTPLVVILLNAVDWNWSKSNNLNPRVSTNRNYFAFSTEILGTANLHPVRAVRIDSIDWISPCVGVPIPGTWVCQVCYTR